MDKRGHFGVKWGKIYTSHLKVFRIALIVAGTKFKAKTTILREICNL